MKWLLDCFAHAPEWIVAALALTAVLGGLRVMLRFADWDRPLTDAERRAARKELAEAIAEHLSELQFAAGSARVRSVVLERADFADLHWHVFGHSPDPQPHPFKFKGIWIYPEDKA